MLWSDHSRVQGLFEEFDQDSNGYISRDEFQDLAFALGLTLSAQQCGESTRIDKDGDGLVDLSEFKTWLHTPSTARTSGDATDEGKLEALLLRTNYEHVCSCESCAHRRAECFQLQSSEKTSKSVRWSQYSYWGAYQ